MGGKALSVESARLQRSEYEPVRDAVMEKLWQHLPHKRKTDIKAYASKPDFGDLDIIIEGPFDPIAIANALGASEIVRNGDVTSIGIMTNAGLFQVDLIKIESDAYEFARRYFSFNDLGNLIGRVAHKAGFKFGHRGLVYVVRDGAQNSHVVAELIVTQDWAQALKFLDYDPQAYERGFETLEDIYKFTVTSKFSNSDIYLLENVNAVARVRDRKRKTYTGFLAWQKNPDVSKSIPKFDWSDKESRRAEFLEKAFALFPNFKDEHANSIERLRRQKIVGEKFNGNLVSELTGLAGRELGHFIQAIKKRFHDDNAFKDWVYKAQKEEVNELILDMMAKPDVHTTANPDAILARTTESERQRG